MVLQWSNMGNVHSVIEVKISFGCQWITGKEMAVVLSTIQPFI